MSEEEKKEKLAEYAHDAWSRWVIRLFERCTKNVDGSVTIPKALVDRWTRQMETSYNKLSEEEKYSDRIEANKILTIINE